MIISNQPKGRTYYGVRLYDSSNKYLGSHNAHKLVKNIRWFIKDFHDMWINELKEKCAKLNVRVEIVTKQF